ncbi:hypothetical protein [Streptomyces alfalfae]|nr:hypothetical protein [Streptomyces alfalfae]
MPARAIGTDSYDPRPRPLAFKVAYRQLIEGRLAAEDRRRH